MLSTLNQRSNSHNSCEDSIYVEESIYEIRGCISDGCSSGEHSEFVSRAICYAVKSFDITTATHDYSITAIKSALTSLKKTFKLDYINLLATCIIFHYYRDNKTLKIRVFGDGVYYVNDVEYIIDQKNIPDYIGYHLDEDREEFHKYLKKYPEITYYNVERFMICSDGISSIERSIFAPTKSIDESILYIPPTGTNYLKRMWNKLKNDHYTISDDLSIISYVQD